jgi:anthranilate phosphoribosyltransferase
MSAPLTEIRRMLDVLLEGRSLSGDEARVLLTSLTDEETPTPLSGALLAALRAKGVTAEELRGFAQGMRAAALRPRISSAARAVDIVGTGGDKSGSYNLSTGAALLAAAAGQPVIKHGNRSVSSRAGSADVLEALGMKLPLDEQRAGEFFERTGFTFLFAPHYHPAMKSVGPVRAALGVRTVFNILGPLSNPAEPGYHVIGAFDLRTARLMAEALSGLPINRAFVVHGAFGWDEPTPLGPFALFDVRPGSVRQSERTPANFGLQTCAEAELLGGDAAFNAEALTRVLRGEEQGGHRDALLLGAALALEVSGAETSPRAAIARAAGAIENGRAAALLGQLAAFGNGTS